MSAAVEERGLRVAAQRKNSLHSQRTWALWGSYAALAVFVVMFLMPPFYTLMTSLKSSAEISPKEWVWMVGAVSCCRRAIAVANSAIAVGSEISTTGLSAAGAWNWMFGYFWLRTMRRIIATCAASFWPK